MNTLFTLPTVHTVEATAPQLGENDYYPTPSWLAHLIVERYFPNLGAHDLVLEPTCGDGRFLDAIPPHVGRVGIELNPVLAREAEQRGHRVIVGDALSVPLPDGVTAVMGNPPYSVAFIDALLDRLAKHVDIETRCGFVLPCYAFQTAAHVVALREKWSIAVEQIPRNVFNGLSTPLAFAMFTRNYERRVVGLAFYDEANAVLSMHVAARERLTSARAPWRAAVTWALEQLGGRGTLEQVYRLIEPRRPTRNQWWKEKIRQTLAVCATRVGEATYALAA